MTVEKWRPLSIDEEALLISIVLERLSNNVPVIEHIAHLKEIYGIDFENTLNVMTDIAFQKYVVYEKAKEHLIEQKEKQGALNETQSNSPQ